MTKWNRSAWQPLCEAAQSWSAIFLSEGILILLGSAVTIAVFRRRRFALKRASYLLINLAIADLLVGLTVALYGFGWIYCDEFPSYFYVTNGYFLSLSMTASINSLVVIAIERAFAIVKPFKHRTAPTRCYSYAICYAWVLAAVVSVASSLFMRGFLFVKFIISFIYIVSLMAIILSYLTIWWFSSKRLSVRDHRPNSRLTATLSIVTLFSLVTWAPLSIYFSTFPALDGTDFITDTRVLGLLFLQCANSLLNPFVYVLRMPGFRQEITRLCSRKQRAPDEEISMADRSGVTLKSVDNLLRPASLLHVNICAKELDAKL